MTDWTTLPLDGETRDAILRQLRDAGATEEQLFECALGRELENLRRPMRYRAIGGSTVSGAPGVADVSGTYRRAREDRIAAWQPPPLQRQQCRNRATAAVRRIIQENKQ